MGVWESEVQCAVQSSVSKKSNENLEEWDGGGTITFGAGAGSGAGTGLEDGGLI
jgi:hypothetical protein